MKKTLFIAALLITTTAGLSLAYGGWGQGRQNGGYGMRGGGCGTPGAGCAMAGPGYAAKGKGMRGAQNWNCPRSGGGSGRGLMTNEQQQTFLNETASLRKQLNEKRFEFREAGRNPDTTAEQLATLEKELIDLRTQIDQKAQQLRSNAQ